jgi:hypothetical protein
MQRIRISDAYKNTLHANYFKFDSRMGGHSFAHAQKAVSTNLAGDHPFGTGGLHSPDEPD